MADMNIVMTHADRDYLAGFVPAGRIAWLDPFIDNALLESSPLADDPWPATAGGCRLLTVGMMRPGAKLDSYRLLGDALAGLRDLDWSLAIVGGGPGEQQVRACFCWDEQGRVAFLGERSPGEVLAMMARADILAWPGCREAYGMVYLEAATRGTPAAALSNMGVPLVVEDERTGLLADPPDAEHYAMVLARLIGDPGLRKRLADGARQFALQERSAERAAAELARIIDGVFEQRGRSA